jgi:hypothetical protein
MSRLLSWFALALLLFATGGLALAAPAKSKAKASAKATAKATKATQMKGALTVDTTPRGASVYVGCTRIGAAPVTVELFPGDYVVTGVYRARDPASVPVTIDGGKRARLKIEISEEHTRTASAAEKPTWVDGPLACGTISQRCAVARANMRGNVFLAELAAFHRALISLADPKATEARIAGGWLEEHWLSRERDVFVLASADTVRREDAAVLTLEARAPGEIVAFGVVSPDAIASARVAATALAVLRLAMATGEATIVRSVSDQPGGEAKHTTTVLVRAAWTHADTKLELRSTFSDHQRSRFRAGEVIQEEARPEHSLTLKLSTPAGALEMRFEDTLLTASSMPANPRVLDELLVRALADLGVMRRVKSIGRTSGAPGVEALLETSMAWTRSFTVDQEGVRR